MPDDKKKDKKDHQERKSIMQPFLNYVDFETVLKKLDGWKHNPGKTVKLTARKHRTCGF